MVHSYIRDLVQQITSRYVDTADDCDLIAEYDGTTLRTRILNPSNPVIQISAIAVDDLSATPELFTVINDINSEVGFARAYWARNAVLIESEIWASDVNPGNFEFNVINVSATTARHAPGLIDQFGGRRPLNPTWGEIQPGSSATSVSQKGGYL